MSIRDRLPLEPAAGRFLASGREMDELNKYLGSAGYVDEPKSQDILTTKSSSGSPSLSR